MTGFSRFLFAVVVGCSALVGCGGSDDSDPEVPAAVCAAGATQLCACSTGTTGAQVCAADGSAWGACDCTSAPNVQGVSISVTDADDAEAVGIVAGHVVGTTPCQQPLGTITLTNDGDTPATVSYAAAGTLPQILFAPAGQVAVAPGMTESVSVDFDCSLLPAFPPENIATTVTVTSGATSITFPLQLTFSGL